MMLRKFILGIILLIGVATFVDGQTVTRIANLFPCSDCSVPQGADPITGSTSSVTETSFSIAGTCTPNGQSTNGYFQLDNSPLFTAPTSSTPVSVGSGGTPVSVTGGSFTGLTCGTQYYTRVVCEWLNDGGAFNGSTVEQATTSCTPPPPSAPDATTQAATGVTSTTALLNGTVDPNAVLSTAYFECGLTTSYLGCGNVTSPTTPTNVGSGTSPAAHSVGLTGLTASTTYHFRIVGVSAGGTDLGDDLTFLTSSAPGGDPAQFASTHMTYVGEKTLNTSVGQAHMGLTIRYVSGSRRLITGTEGGTGVRQFNETGVAYNGTIGNAQVENTWTAQGAPACIAPSSNCQGNWGGVHWDETNDELITTNSFTYTQPNVTNIYRRALNGDSTISNLQGPYLFTGLNQYQVFGGCIDTPTAIQSAWGVGRLTCGWGGGMSTTPNGACLGLCLFFFPDLSTLTPNVSSTNFVTGSRKPFNSGDGCNLTTCKRGIRATAVNNYLDNGNDTRANTQHKSQITVSVAANGVTVTCTQDTDCASSPNHLGRNGGGTNSASHASLQVNGGWWYAQSQGGEGVMIQGTEYLVASVDSFTQITLASPVAGAPLTNVTMTGPTSRPAGWSPIAGTWATEDGNITWTQGDGHLGTCVWPYSSTRQALVCFPNLMESTFWYASSHVPYDGKQTEAHFYNVNHFREVQLGTRQQSHVLPVEMNTSLVAPINSQFGSIACIQGCTNPRAGATAAVMDYGEEPAVIDGDEMIIIMACRPDAAPQATCKLFYYSVDLD